MAIDERERKQVAHEKDVHIINRGDQFAVYQEGAALIPDLDWDRALVVARRLGGKIVVHASRDEALADARLRRIAPSL